MLWLATLPFVLWNHIGWAVVPSTAVVSFLLLGIDEIAIQLEEPFGILPLEAICDTIQRNIEVRTPLTESAHN
jgi:predicted membrane chloride channel (bestrophin family)